MLRAPLRAAYCSMQQGVGRQADTACAAAPPLGQGGTQFGPLQEDAGPFVPAAVAIVLTGAEGADRVAFSWRRESNHSHISSETVSWRQDIWPWRLLLHVTLSVLQLLQRCELAAAPASS